MKTTVTPRGRCPACGEAIDRASHIEGESAPSPGDVSICIRCAAVNLFDDDLSPRVPTAAELARLRASATWPEIQRHVRALTRSKRR
jgi:hypothetical protein